MKTRYSVPVLFASIVLSGAVALPAETQPGPSTPDSSGVVRESRSEQGEKAQVPDVAVPASGGKETGQETAGAQTARRVDEFARMDTDRDGRVSAAEYTSSVPQAVERVADGKRRGTRSADGGFSLQSNEGQPGESKNFRRIDADGNGYLSRGEWDASGEPTAYPRER